MHLAYEMTHDDRLPSHTSTRAWRIGPNSSTLHLPPNSFCATLDVLQDLSKWNLPELLSWNADHVAGVAQSGSGSGNGSLRGVGGEVRLKGLSLARSVAAEAEGSAPHTPHSPQTLSVSGTHVLASAARLRALRPLRLLR
jgi:hypothetical protein